MAKVVGCIMFLLRDFWSSLKYECVYIQEFDNTDYYNYAKEEFIKSFVSVILSPSIIQAW